MARKLETDHAAGAAFTGLLTTIAGDYGSPPAGLKRQLDQSSCCVFLKTGLPGFFLLRSPLDSKGVESGCGRD